MGVGNGMAYRIRGAWHLAGACRDYRGVGVGIPAMGVRPPRPQCETEMKGRGRSRPLFASRPGCGPRTPETGPPVSLERLRGDRCPPPSNVDLRRRYGGAAAALVIPGLRCRDRLGGAEPVRGRPSHTWHTIRQPYPLRSFPFVHYPSDRLQNF